MADRPCSPTNLDLGEASFVGVGITEIFKTKA